ncbi:MAG: hypothetical protein EXR95_03200 [Gemmatimonadetes bacterium]|nr:hypothetical protein [Gemmatimonadota bacterium]
MSMPSRSTGRLLGALAVSLLALRLALPGDLGAQDNPRERVNTRAVADSFAYRIATFTPASGPPGTLVMVRWQYLPAITPIRLGVGAQRVGFEVLREILTTEQGEFNDTIRVPAWAESNRPHMLVVLDFYFRPLAVSSAFQVLGPDGMLSREGKLMEGDGKCAVMQAEGGEFYYLAGDMKGLKAGDRAIVKGTLGDRALCNGGEREVTIKVNEVRRPFGTG